ncbi:MAG: class I SAM-dependent methyltransferase [Phycisphaerales bacterium]|nr:class I SAM-dependent methyltransferase [Phycisphaerales bacterium]
MTHDKHDLYELCVQSPKDLVPLVRAIHGGDPRVLGEDFSGTAAFSHLWAERDGCSAIAVDLDEDALSFRGTHERVTKRHSDVSDVSDPIDVLFVGNFSIGYLHTREELVAYLRHVRSRLVASAGVFICDTYGGETAYTLGAVHRAHPMPGGKLCRYTWEQHEADPTTGMVTNLIHFRIERAGVIEEELFDAFVYEWRLWSIPELRDAMHESGFASTQVYAKLADAVDDEGNAYITPIVDACEELEDSFIVLIAARV